MSDDDILAGLKAVLASIDYDLYKNFEYPESSDGETWEDLVAYFKGGF